MNSKCDLLHSYMHLNYGELTYTMAAIHIILTDSESVVCDSLFYHIL